MNVNSSAEPNFLTAADNGFIYRNPLPHVYSRQAYFPSVIRLSDGHLLASYSVGQAFEAHDLRTHLSRSRDGGKTWIAEGALYPGTTDRVTSDTCRLSHGENGEIVAFVIRHDRSREDHGLANPENLGFVEVELLLFRSRDEGVTWRGPEAIQPPLVGPSFEMTSAIVPLRDGTWVLPTSTWHGWDGYCPNGLKMVALVSRDGGETWPEYWDVMTERDNRRMYWESKMVELPDGRLLAAAWVFDMQDSRDLDIHYTVGRGQFAEPRSTGLQGQTLQMELLEDGRVLTVYRRTDESGLWANVSRLEGEEWINERQYPLWGQNRRGLVALTEDMAQNFASLKFGAPSICRLGPGDLLVAFWASEDGLSAIRSIRLTVGGDRLSAGAAEDRT